jgi:hypothetical protein
MRGALRKLCGTSILRLTRATLAVTGKAAYDRVVWSMILKIGSRFSERIMLREKVRAGMTI